MPASMINFPASVVVDGILSYLQWVFRNVDMTPAEYRWDPDDRKSRIRISAPFVIDNAKPMSAPFIIVERGGMQFDNRVIDNLKSSDANTFTNPNYVALTNGTINVICGSKEAGEASSLANYVAITIQADRHGVIENINCIRNLYHIDIGPEVPVVKDTEIRRWEVTVRFFVSLQMGWIKILHGEPEIWHSSHVYMTDKSCGDEPLSTKGAVTEGSDLLVDTTQDFGIEGTNNPQFLEQELEKGWYYIRFKDNEHYQIYPVAEIVDNHTLKLLTHDANNDPTPWLSPESKIDVSYNLLWNNIHLSMEIPKRSSP